MKDITIEEAVNELKERTQTLKRHIKNYEEIKCETNIYNQLKKESKAIEKVLNELETYKHYYEELTTGLNNSSNRVTDLTRENTQLRYQLFNANKELEKKDKIIDELKNHIHYKICPNCNKEFRAKRSDAVFCPQCRPKLNNKYYFKNLTEEQKAIRRQKVRESMRKYRAKKKEGRK